MKEFKHTQYNTDICLLELNENQMSATFFKGKPSIGDIFMTHTKRETNYYHVYLIEGIQENRNAKTFNKENLKGGYAIFSGQMKSSNKNADKAFFKLNIRELKDNEIPKNVDTSLA